MFQICETYEDKIYPLLDLHATTDDFEWAVAATQLLLMAAQQGSIEDPPDGYVVVDESTGETVYGEGNWGV